ncbi:MAG: DUF2845 domain-containing protein [Methylococcaceae bacterium]|jgi:hypothetical protein|nr:DUF2845 domain-containing protein [Methylococcaceae bacterium]MDD1631368.1 DUF2845 domain-containing protein [Methylococcaceae bacterium]MDD1636709.1 DUF2845 domain-containing protein [Methylococcaceae bacterium]MDD1643025.1 DUF2845 domain-containing protein [Methylococcaceae bacterium]OYV20819.1 MAG: hypothetical protein CG441_248 [Methylococcaceae bacterium NSM2-1]
MKLSKLLLMFLCILLSYPAFALRCGRALVDIGDYKEDVADKCGEPKYIDTHIELRGVTDRFGARTRPSPGTSINFGQQHYTEVEVVVEEWIYDFGRRRFQKRLRFENGRLTEIKDLGYGH